MRPWRKNKLMIDYYYILDENDNPVQVNSAAAIAWELEKPSRRSIARDIVGESEVSTVLLSVDHSYGYPGPPLVFETLVFDGPLNDVGARYSTKAEAMKGHADIVRRVREAQEVKP